MYRCRKRQPSSGISTRFIGYYYEKFTPLCCSSTRTTLVKDSMLFPIAASSHHALTKNKIHTTF